MNTNAENIDPLSIAVFDEIGKHGAAQAADALAAEIAAKVGGKNEVPLAIVARAGDRVVGGLNGASHWGWLYIRTLWVDPTWRRRGLGQRLLADAEDQARARGCVGLYVDTFDAAAVMFYTRAGFAQFGEIEGFPPGHTRRYFQKRVNPETARKDLLF